MLDTQGFVSRKQLAKQQGVNPSTIWRWSQNGKVEKDRSTGVPLYRMAPPAIALAPAPEPVQYFLAKPVVAKAPRSPERRKPPQPDIQATPRRTSPSTRSSTPRPPGPSSPPRTKTRPPKPHPARTIVVDSKGRPVKGKWQPLDTAFGDVDIEGLILGGAVITLLSGVLYLFKPIISRPAVMPPHLRDKRPPRSREPRGPSYRRALQKQWGNPRPAEHNPEAIKSIASGLFDIGDFFAEGFKAKPIPRR